MFFSKRGRLAVVEALIKKDANLSYQDSEGKTCLNYAIEKANYNIVAILLSHGAPADTFDNNKKTPLFYTLEKKDEEMLDLLLTNGASPDLIVDGSSYLGHALNLNDINLFQKLLEFQADQSIKDPSGKTVYDLAKEKGAHEFVEILESFSDFFGT